jgi:hypothetical protein
VYTIKQAGSSTNASALSLEVSGSNLSQNIGCPDILTSVFLGRFPKRNSL